MKFAKQKVALAILVISSLLFLTSCPTSFSSSTYSGTSSNISSTASSSKTSSGTPSSESLSSTVPSNISSGNASSTTTSSTSTDSSSSGSSSNPVSHDLDIPLYDTVESPKLTMSQIIIKGGKNNSAGLNSDYIIFEAVYQIFNIAKNQTGAVYGLTQHFVGSMAQYVYKSLDGGSTWSKMGSLAIDQSSGIWFEQIFVDPFDETFYLYKVTSGKNTPSNHQIVSFDNAFTQIGCLNIGTRRWLSENQNIDACPDKGNLFSVVIFGEYDTEDSMSENLNLWRTTDHGTTWQSVLSQTGNDNVAGAGEIRHFHCVQADPYQLGDWWASSGDTNQQDKIWRSQDEGLSWTLIFSGSQRERTCSFVFEKNCIYYGMDSQSMYPTHNKIVRINRGDLSREDIGYTNNAYSVYGLTKTVAPAGFLIWTIREPHFIKSDHITIQFYDEQTGVLADIAHLSIDAASEEYNGFYGASRCQDDVTNNFFVQPTISLGQEKYGWGKVSHFFGAHFAS